VSLISGGPMVLGAILLSLASLVPPAAADTPVVLCNGLPITIVGTAGDDVIYAEGGNDVIYAGGGNDVIYAAGGDDLVCAGPGDDTVFGGAGNDTLLGESGNDTIHGQAGADTLTGGSGVNTLVGGSGDDLLLGSPDPDVLRGGPGNDSLHGQESNDTLRGGPGDDLLVGGEGDDRLYGGAGADQLHGNLGADRLYGGAGADRLFGEAGADFLFGGDGEDILRGNDGDDSCDGGPGRDDAATCEEVTATEVGQVPRPYFRPGPTQVALTFDDGPSGAYTGQILDILQRYGVPATFFVTGLQAAQNPELLARMTAEGHSVQNHTWSHAWLTRYSDAGIADQLQRANRVVEELAGEAPHCYRPPFMAVNDRVRSVGASLGLATIMWDVDPWDWKRPGSSAVAWRVLGATSGGDIVLFHDTAGWSTIGALPTIITTLRSRGLEFVSICSTTVPVPRSSTDGVSPTLQPE
jgi:peptidoglycan/xylan/chitin deacetylase (PgdA/CDA1 family)